MSWCAEAEALLARFGEDAHFCLSYMESVDSTNEEVKRRARQGGREGLVVVGEEQTAGKGRLGRSWKSPAGEALYFSFLLRPDIAPENWSMLTLVMGLAGAEAVRELTGLPARIKWPNDLVLGTKKICGILTEVLMDEGGPEGLVIGTGVNVNNRDFPAELRERATSLRLESGEEISRGRLLAHMLRAFRRFYAVFLVRGDMSALRDRYNEYLVSRGGEVRLETPAGAYTAVSLGIDGRGRLLVRRTTGETEAVSAGEVSVRGLYGYV